MNQKYTKEQISQCCTAYNRGTPVAKLVEKYEVPRSTIYAWLKREQEKKQTGSHFVTFRDYRILENRVKHLQDVIHIIHNIECSVNDPLRVKLNAIESLQEKYSVNLLCEALNVPRGTFYNHILRNKRTHAWYAKRREALREKIQQVYDESNQIFGANKIVAVLQTQGIRTSFRTVRKLMQDMGISSIRTDSKNLYDKEQLIYKNHLNQQFDVERPNQVWVSDVTYFRFNDKSYYICVVIDLYARKVVGYKIGLRNSTNLIKSTFSLAYEQRKPTEDLLFHSDRGSNFRSKRFRTYLHSLGVTQSFSRAHVPYDNSVIESFFSTLKREELYRTKYRSEKEFKAAVDKYIIFYNEYRPHGKNAYKTPEAKELDYFNKQADFSDNPD